MISQLVNMQSLCDYELKLQHGDSLKMDRQIPQPAE